MGMASPVFYTAAMVRALPEDGNRYETVHGELLVTPAPRPPHQVVLSRLFLKLGRYLEEHPIGVVLTSPADISWGPDVLVQPDLFVVPPEEAEAANWSEVKSLMLVIEILSPTTARHDRFTKRRAYQEARVPLYWLVDIESRSVEVWTPDATLPTVKRDRLEWQPPSSQMFELDLGALFPRR